jgi:hypothetical protein
MIITKIRSRSCLGIEVRTSYVILREIYGWLSDFGEWVIELSDKKIGGLIITLTKLTILINN